MEKIKVRYRERIFESEKGAALTEILKDVLAAGNRGFLAAVVNSAVKDIAAKIYEDSDVDLLSFDDEEGREVFRHSTAHLLAQAVVALFPDAKPTIGPVVEEGFYYDFDAKPFTPEDLVKIESRMREIVKAAYPVERVEISKNEALELFKDNKFKVEMISEMEDGAISAYRQGDFIDLCRGPHVPNTSALKHFKLFKLAGAYWRGDQRREQLQRIYGISFPDEERLDLHFERLEEARLRDHRRIGAEMDLFSFHDEGVGFPFWHPKGMILRNEIITYWREMHGKYGYLEIQTPQILNKALWERSGHYEHYRKNMYFTEIDENVCAVKPMNCPGGLLVYKSRLHSYRE
ncbi:MAG: threonine--tRNA ligase, partial [Deltaproteobacteria bacterium]|nr:threonine--tRNA ligase [Deltaproteobacteria bacterium]